MNAKEISDATLESVTPADNDLMLIYDTSAGTTGKATIADIVQKGVGVVRINLNTPVIKKTGSIEGGQIELESSDNSAITTVIIDVYQNELRIFTFMKNGDLRMFHIDFETKKAYWE